MEAVNVFDARDLDEVGQLEELLDVLFAVVSTQVLHVDDLEDLLGRVSVNFIVIIKVKDISQESFGFHVVQEMRTVLIMSIIDDANVGHALVHSFLAFLLEALLVLVEHVGEEQVGQEVEAHEHEEHEEERVEVVDVHCGQENVREVRSREQDCHVAIRVLDRAKVLEALESRPVEIVHCEREDQDVGEDGHEDVERVHQIADQTEALLA